MKHLTAALSVVFILTFCAITLAQDNAVDVSGTWVGDTDFPGTPQKDHVVLVLKKEGKTFTGTISAGDVKDIPLEKFSFEDQDSFRFEFVLPQGSKKVRVSVNLDYINDRVIGNKLMGAWSVESGEYDLLELQLKK